MLKPELIPIIAAARKRAETTPGLLIDGALARNSKGHKCSTTDPDAQCFCTLGLIANEAGFNTTEAHPGAKDAYEEIARWMGYEHRYELIDNVIEYTDEDILDGVEPLCPLSGANAVGFAGFDYIQEEIDRAK